jgi:hypothetical protein
MKIIIWIASIATGLILPGFLFRIGSETDSGILEIILWIIGTSIGGYFFTKWLNPFSTKLYLSAFCGISVTYKEAESLAFLFDGSLGGKWYPFTDLKNIPYEYRKKVLFEFINKRWRYFYQKSNQYETKHNAQTFNSKKEEYYSTSSQKTKAEGTKSTDSEPYIKQSVYSDNYIRACSIMGLNFNITKDELKTKYRELMKQYHPDLYSCENYEMKKFAEEKTIEINTAYKYLGTRQFLAQKV